MKQNYPWIVVGILIIICIFLFVKKFDCTNCVQTVEVDTVWLPNPNPQIIEIPGDIPEPIILPKDTFWKDSPIVQVDTQSIINAYFSDYLAYKVYKDQRLDSNLEAIIIDTLYSNKIVGRTFEYKILRYQEVIKTNTILDKNTGFYVGANIGRSIKEFGIGPSLSFIDNSDRLYNLNYDLLNKDLYFSVQWKLRLKKPSQ